MGREFTNALQQTPLWCFALSVYSQNKASFLYWQNDHQAHVTDLLALAYAQQNNLYLPENWWDTAELSQVRQFTQRVRMVRIKTPEQNYQQALHLELMFEGLEIQILQSLLMSVPNRNSVLDYEKRLGIKKGALAPFIQSLQSQKSD